MEFKWNNLYEEWAFDFFKLLDRRLPTRDRIFFGVRASRGESAATAVLDEYLNLVVKRLAEEEENPSHDSWKNGSFRTLLMDVHFVCEAPGGGQPKIRLRTCLIEAAPDKPISVGKWT